MTKNIWLVSDTHWGHANILNFTDSETGILVRPDFSCVQEMNEVMIERWNSVVRPGDKVYHLGDVVMGVDQEGWMKSNWPRLAGSKNLICGNHDDIKMLAKGGFFAKIYESRDLREFGLLLTHRPAHDSQLWDFNRDRPMKSIHGHIHQRSSPSENHVNVSVELINYTPVNIEELRLY
jgi:calcineurin-like phosphoesterase family protein